MHPVCDEYKTQRTVSLFGAKTLYLKFDERCATQYDYDKVGLTLEEIFYIVLGNTVHVLGGTVDLFKVRML